MTVREVLETLSVDVKTTRGDLGRTISGCYVSDLLSDVMANAKEGEVWITLQTHPNIAAVASLKNLSAIVITNKRIPEEETLRKADEERVTVAVSPLTTFEAGGLLYKMMRC